MKARPHSSTSNPVEKGLKPARFLVKKKSSPPAPEDKKPKTKLFWALVVFVLAAIFALLSLFLFFRPESGRVNFLFLGVSGGDHAGSDLTDAIAFVSLDRATGQVRVLSLPRDIWLPAWRTKLNAIYHYHGLGGAKAEVGRILGQPVDYALVLDFRIFEELVDSLGGVEVEVERAFDDYHYPIAGREDDPCDGDPLFACRYEHLRFDAGLQWLDGDRALKYVRSRYAEGEEGSDFARSVRQQRLIAAIKDRFLSPSFWFDYRRPLKVFQTAGKNIKTDLPPEQYPTLAKALVRFRSEKLKTEVLDGERLINPPPSQKLYDNQWVLIPRSGDWGEVQTYVKEFLVSD